MPNTESNVVRGWLQNLSVAYANPTCINAEIFPKLPVQASQTKIWLWNQGDTFRSEVKLRAPGSESARIYSKGSSISFDTNQYGLAELITEEDLRNAGLANGSYPTLDLARKAMERVAYKHELGAEIRVATAINAATWLDGVGSGGEDAAGLWSPAGSTNTFLTDITTGVNALQGAGCPITIDQTGMAVGPNLEVRLAMDFKTFNAVRKCDEIRDYYKYTSSNSITTDMVAKVAGVAKIVVCGTLKNTADEKADGTDATLVNIFESNTNKGFGFLYAYPKSTGPDMVAAGFQPMRNMPNGAVRQTETWYEKKIHSWIYETREERGEKVISGNFGYEWKDTYAS